MGSKVWRRIRIKQKVEASNRDVEFERDMKICLLGYRNKHSLQVQENVSFFLFGTRKTTLRELSVALGFPERH